MEEIFARFMENLGARVTGPMHMRIYLQPIMATIFAVIAGIKDAKAGKPAFFWALFTDSAHRGEMLKDGWKSVGNVFIIAILLDIGYQFFVEKWVYPFEALTVAVILALIPYLLIRGPVNRIARLFMKKG